MAQRVMLVEDDVQMADLLRLLVRTAAPGTEVDWFSDVDLALASLQPHRYRLVICDWNLPGRSGLSLLPAIGKLLPKPPVLMITGRSDRASVIAARSHGADAFIAKPFNPEILLERLRPYFAGADALAAATGESTSVEAYFEGLGEGDIELPVMAGARDLLQFDAEDASTGAAELAEVWARHPALSTRLLAVANSSAYNPSGVLARSLVEAIQRLGLRASLDIATVLAFRQAAVWDDPRLQALAEREMGLAERVAAEVRALCDAARLDSGPSHTAALLHRMGEMCALFHLEHWQKQRGAIEDAQRLDACVARYGRPLADRLKSLWRYPVPLRELIGAIYALPAGTVKREHCVLRIAGGRVHGDLSAADEARLRALAGVASGPISA